MNILNGFCGQFKRSLVWRGFDSEFTPFHTSNTSMKIMQIPRNISHEPHTEYFDWFFGPSFDKLRRSMRMAVWPCSSTSFAVEWDYEGKIRDDS